MIQIDRRVAVRALLLAGASAPLAAQAQFDKLIGGLAGLAKGGNPASTDSGGIVKTYIDADREVLRANGDMADALGLKDAAALSRATADALGDGATVDGLKDADKVVTDSSGLIQAELAKSPKMDEKSKERFASGLVKLVKGVRKYHSLKKSVGEMASGSSPLNMLMGGSIGTMAYIGSNLPSSVTNLASALQNAITFAQSNDIPVPPDATQALAGL